MKNRKQIIKGLVVFILLLALYSGTIDIVHYIIFDQPDNDLLKAFEITVIVGVFLGGAFYAGLKAGERE